MIAPEADALETLKDMQSRRSTHYLVVGPDRRLRGIVTMKDLLSYLTIRLELEDDDAAAADIARSSLAGATRG
jgi:CBS domain containing-hemolysin-like protein